MTATVAPFQPHFARKPLHAQLTAFQMLTYDRKRELDDLERFVASGYSGDLKAKLQSYIEELKK
jgi:hypothetical protein